MNYLIVVNDLDKKRIIKQREEQKELVQEKIIGYQEFIKKFYFDYDEETIVFITEKYQVSQEIAEIYIKNLYYLNFQNTTNKKIQFLMNLYQELEENQKIKKSLLWKEKLKKQKIIFYHILKQDKYFQKIVKECQKLTNVEIIKLDSEKRNENYSVIKYSSVEQEVEGTCIEIIKKIKEGYLPNQIYLSNLSETHRSLFKIYSKIFHIPIELKEKQLVNSSIVLTEFLENYEKGIEKSIQILKEKYQSPKDLELIQWLITICNKYAFITQENRKKYFIIETIKKGKSLNYEKMNSIKEINITEQEIASTDFLFLVGMNDGKFPKTYKEDQFLNDKEKELLGLDNTNEKNELEKEICFEKISSIKNIQLSYAEKDGNIPCYPSSILETIPHTIKEYQEELSHSHQYNQLLLGRKMDQLRKYGTEEKNLATLQTTYSTKEYNSYQNQYHKIKKQLDLPLKLSYTNLDTFFRCSFRYYLDNLLHLNATEETFDKKIGTLFHQILKESYEPDFELEKSWQENTKTLTPFNSKESFFLEKLKEDLQRDLEVIQEQEKNKDFNVITEHSITLEMEPEKAILKGIIDKIYWKKENDETLISIIDYKTGTPNTNLDNIIYGLNLQLPIYLILLRKLPFENIKIIGFYLQKILPKIKEKDKIHSEEELKRKSLMLQGYSIDLESRLQKFDPTYENSKLISGLKKSSKGFYTYSKILSEEQIAKIETIVTNVIKTAITQITNVDFPINPKRIGNKLVGCEHCKYQDICYRKEEDIVNLSEVKRQDAIGGLKDASVDEGTIGCNL